VVVGLYFRILSFPSIFDILFMVILVWALTLCMWIYGGSNIWCTIDSIIVCLGGGVARTGV
jgi:hypothetical protein